MAAIKPNDLTGQAADGVWKRDVLEWIKRLQYPYGSIYGIVPANGTDATNDLNFSAGLAWDSTNSQGMLSASAFTKRADATWAAGSGAGMHPGGSATAWGADFWHLFQLGASTNPLLTDFGMDDSLTAANLMANTSVVAAGLDIYRRIGSFPTTGAAWPLFVAYDLGAGLLRVNLKTVAAQFDKDWAAADDAAQTGTLPGVPGGIQVEAILGIAFNDRSASGASTLIITSLDQTDVAPVANATGFVGDFYIDNAGAGSAIAASGEKRVMTSTSRTIRYRATVSTSDHLVGVCLHGWTDFRGAA